MRYPIVRLQVQTDPLKIGRAPMRRYEPAAIESVPRIEVGPAGVVGLAERLGSVLDVHHVDHPRSRDPRGNAGVSVMGTGDYARLRATYGEHLTEGVAGETILVDAPDGLARWTMPSQITVLTAGGPIALTGVEVADPCVEFSRYCLGLEPSAAVGNDVRRALVDLDEGARGYRAVAGGAGVIALGDEVDIP